MNDTELGMLASMNKNYAVRVADLEDTIAKHKRYWKFPQEVYDQLKEATERIQELEAMIPKKPKNAIRLVWLNNAGVGKPRVLSDKELCLVDPNNV